MKQPIYATYEYSQYKRKPYINQNNPNCSPKTISYEQFFNTNYQNSIKLSDIDDQIYKQNLLKENKKLLNQTQDLNSHINNLNKEINTLNQALNQMKQDNSTLRDKINMLQNTNNDLQAKLQQLESDNEDLNNKLLMLSNQNNDYNQDIKEDDNNIQNVQYNCIDNKEEYLAEIQKLNELLEKYKDINNNLSKAKEDAEMQKKMYRLKYEQSEQDKNELIAKNNELNDFLIKNEGDINQLKIDNEDLCRKADTELKNKDAIIEDLKNQIDLLRDELSKNKDEKNKMQDYYGNTIKNDAQKIDNLNKLLDKLSNENDKLNKSVNDNKRLNNKLLEEKKKLVDKVNNLSKDLNDANLNNKRNQRRYGSLYGNDNQIFSNVLKNENGDLKELLDKYRQMLNLLFRFLNELNDIFDHPEINIDQCFQDLSILIDDINQLKNDIQNLIQQKEKNNPEENKKWEEMQSKLLNRDFSGLNPGINKKKEHNKSLKIENDWNSGNCWACKLGRNVSLKGCSPYLCHKHKFSTEY